MTKEQLIKLAAYHTGVVIAGTIGGGMPAAAGAAVIGCVTLAALKNKEQSQDKAVKK